MGVFRPHDAARLNKSSLAQALRCCDLLDDAKRKCSWRNELLACLRIRRIPRSRFGFPLVFPRF